MLDGRTIAVVMPAYNEATLIESTLEGIPSYVDHIIVVDDGSRDQTAAAAKKARRRVRLAEHAENLGVGAAIATGCQCAQQADVDLIAVMAADGQMSPDDLPTLLAPLLANDADFVKGNRLDWPHAREAMPLPRWLGNRALSWLTSHALQSRTRDSQCGYVALNRRAARAIPWDRLWRGYGYPNDLLGHVLLGGLRVSEVGVRPIYGEEKSGIRLRHALVIIPFVIVRAWIRRSRWGAIHAAWPTSTSSTAMRTASAPSPSFVTPTRDRAPSSRA